MEPATKVIFRWKIKKTKRVRRLEKARAQWYRGFGTTTPCSICTCDHPAMKQHEINEEVFYKYCCPIAKREIWPPEEGADKEINMWDSLEPCPQKFAALYHYNNEEIERMLRVLESSIYSLLTPTMEAEDFRRAVQRATEEVRQSWMFKRSITEPSKLQGTEEDASSNGEDEYDLC